jgi:RNA polymerase sigma-70 factor (ECF subfamily)
LAADPGAADRVAHDRAALGPPIDPVPDPVLVAAARRGDLRAWERLVRRHQESAFQVAYLITRVTPLAEAATSAAFIRAFRALGTFRDGAEFRPWLLRIVTGEARLRRREAARVRNTSREDVPIVSPRLPAARLVAAEKVEGLSPLEREEAVTAFERLPEDDRLLIAARYHFAMSAADAATVSGIPEALTGARLRQALRKLRSRLGDA